MNFFSFFNGKQSAEPEPPRTSLTRVHLIVHPGDGMTLRDVETNSFLLSKMAKRAVSLDVRSELAVVLLQMSDEELRHASDPDFLGKERCLVDAIGRMKRELPENLIVIPGAASVRGDSIVNTLDKIRTGMGALGFAIDSKTDLLAYGEMATQCVPTGATTMANYYKLERPPTIDLNCTDVLVDSPQMWTKNGLRLGFAKSWGQGAVRHIPIGETEAR